MSLESEFFQVPEAIQRAKTYNYRSKAQNFSLSHGPYIGENLEIFQVPRSIFRGEFRNFPCPRAHIQGRAWNFFKSHGPYREEIFSTYSLHTFLYFPHISLYFLHMPFLFLHISFLFLLISYIFLHICLYFFIICMTKGCVVADFQYWPIVSELQHMISLLFLNYFYIMISLLFLNYFYIIQCFTLMFS